MPTMAGQYPGDRCGSYIDISGGTLAGSPTISPATTQIRRTELGAPAHTLHLEPGDSVMLAALEDWQYQQPAPGLTVGYWLLTGTGLANLAVADGFDMGYLYPSVSPTWTSRSLAGVSSDGVAFYGFDPTFLDSSHLWDDGWPLIRLTCTGGPADVTFVGAQVEGPAGMWLPDGGFAWSATQPADAFDGDGGPKYVSGGTLYWYADDTPVLAVAPRGDGSPGYDAWIGSGSSTSDAMEARAASLADFHEWTTLGVTESLADLTHSPAHGSIPDDVPEQWDAALWEKVQFFTAPTKSPLSPTQPAGFYALPRYMKTSPDPNVSFEWLDTDTGFLGWHLHGAGGVHFNGDSDTAALYLHEVPGGYDTSTTWFADDGHLIVTASMPTIDPRTGDQVIPVPDTFIPTSGRLVGRRIALARRFTNQLSVFTVENGVPAGNSGTRAWADVAQEVTARFRLPPWRYKMPTFTPAPGFGSVSWTRQRQRGDGFGSAPRRARVYTSIRQRGIQ